MTKTNKANEIEQCKTWKDFRKFSEKNGLPYEYSNGGHVYHSNKNGKMTFSGHEKEPSKGLRKKVIKQILALISIFVLFFFINPSLFLSLGGVA